MKNRYITKSTEKLSHFNCGNCKKWWSIGDAPLARKSWFCPWCGIKQSVGKLVLSKSLKNTAKDY